MAKPRRKSRTILGVEVTSIDGVSWSWDLDGRHYSWCPLGQLRCHEGEHSRVAMFSQKLEGAVGYTAGYHDGYNLAQRGNGPKVEGA